MTSGPVRRSPISGAELVAMLAAIVLATAVVPPAAAWSLNRFRVTQTQQRVQAATARLRATGDVALLSSSGGILCGPGRLPGQSSGSSRGATHAEWLSRARLAPELFGAGMPTDAWGRCFLINAQDWPAGTPVWLLSAGPNGVFETATTALALAGDDIGARLR